MINANQGYKRVLQPIVAALCLLACVWAAKSAVYRGASYLLSDYALQVEQLDPAESAVEMSPNNVRARYVRSVTLANMGEFPEAVRELERAVTLRPADYRLWMELGRTNERANNADAARAAFSEAVRLAPYYAQPRWQLGNFLLRAGQREEAFVELSRAATSNPGLLPAAISLAWGMYAGDPKLVEEAIRPQSRGAHLAVARFFISHGQPVAAMQHVSSVGTLSEFERRILLNELLAAKQFPEAYQLWAHGREGVSKTAGAAIIDGSFESSIRVDDPGFGWQPAEKLEGVRVSLDGNQASAGQRSLRLDFEGSSNPAAPVISQLLIVEPSRHYQLSFAARVEELVTGGLPMVTVTDAVDGARIAESGPVSQNTNGWENRTLDFAPDGSTRTILISVRRQSCTTSPCPAFGRVWLDAFSLISKQ